MAVLKVAPRWQDRKATTDETGVRTLHRGWTVTTDDDATGEPAVVDAVVAFDATAALFAPHPLWPRAVCRELSADPEKGPRTWIVKAKYSSAPFKAAGDGSGTGGNTTAPSALQGNQTAANLRPPTISGGKRDITKVLEKDVITGDRVVNAGVGDPFDPQPEVQRSDRVYTFKFFRGPSALNWSTREAFLDTVNNAPYTVLGKSYPTGTLRCSDYSFEGTWETGASGMEFFWALTVVVEEDRDGWNPKILNTGRRQRIPAVGATPARNVAIVDSAGQPVADPVALDEFGARVPPDGAYHYVEPNGYTPANWTNLLG